MRDLSVFRALLLILTVFMSHQVAANSDTTAARSTALYDELGGHDGIRQMMETFVLNIAEDERVVHHFVNADIERFHTQISEHICELSGGPCTYKGASMPEVHKGMNISRAEFNAIVENLITAMETHDVAVSTQNRLLAILAAMHNDVIQR
ncbi:group I truncated hemoglobin [Pseudidiomarina donghaiensis]|uniref:Group 1 truncated hemoglobin n=1 Tax=Pseudidiomarina donghaiensis TaxID=519452 RepID=A0A432XLK2_9GAMM|nr:group 1 truncated hemoglobin [Pseudidiomarina donghaiensis]RUO49566.1 group 1 truncated hemoglobin [Pseudidiomarina donghaiensis]SFV21510.1 hemoglobin [Pseudidiomarina donghaiensis]